MTPFDIEIKFLRAFVAVATERSFTAASRVLGCSQGAVSSRVRTLEDMLGVRLFHRARLNVRLTPAGSELLQRAQTLLDRHDRLLEEARAKTVSGAVRLGVAEGLAAPFLAKLLTRASEHYGSVELAVSCDFDSALERQVGTGALDMALVALTKEAPSATVLGRPRLQWVGAPEFAFDGGGPIRFAGYPEGCPVRDLAVAALEREGVAHSVALHALSDRLLADVVRAGWAITAMPENQVPEGLKVLNRPSLLPSLDSITVQLLERPGLESEAARVVAREIADIYRAR